MGFTPPRTIYNLVFDLPEFEGLVIRVRAASMQDRLRASHDLAWQQEDTGQQKHEKQQELFALFVQHVVEWNLEYEPGQPVPVTVEGLLSVCQPEQVGQIIGSWQSGRQSVPAPLDSPSPDIELSEIPMTVLPSSPVPA